MAASSLYNVSIVIGGNDGSTVAHDHCTTSRLYSSECLRVDRRSDEAKARAVTDFANEAKARAVTAKAQAVTDFANSAGDFAISAAVRCERALDAMEAVAKAKPAPPKAKAKPPPRAKAIMMPPADCAH